MQPPMRGMKHDAHRHFRIVSGGGADKSVASPEERQVANRSPLADENKSSLSLQGRERSQVRNELTALISVLCTDGLYAMVACRSDLRHIVPATIRADAEMTRISCCFSDGNSAWIIPIPTIEQIITGSALNVEFPLTLTENLLAKTCAIRSRQLEDIIIMCETPADKRQLVSALSLFIMLPNKLSARVPLIETSPENAGTEWAPSPCRTSDADERIVIDQSPIGCFAEPGPEPKAMLSAIPESTGSTDKVAVKRKSRRSASRKSRKSRPEGNSPSRSRKRNERRRQDATLSLPIMARAASQAPPAKRPETIRGREPSHRMPSKAHGTVQANIPRAASQHNRPSSHRARPMSTRSPSPYLRAQRREYNIPPMPGVYSLDNPASMWNGPRAARPPRLGENRGSLPPELNCCNFCDKREESLLDRMTLRRVMAPVPGLREEVDAWKYSPSGGSALSDGKRNAAGRSIPSTRMTASQLDTTDNLPSPRHFEPPSARFGRVMPDTNKVSQIVGYKSPVSYLPRSGSHSPPPLPASSSFHLLPLDSHRVVSNGLILPNKQLSRTPPLVTHMPIFSELMSYSTGTEDTALTNGSRSILEDQALSPPPAFSTSEALDVKADSGRLLGERKENNALEDPLIETSLSPRSQSSSGSIAVPPAMLGTFAGDVTAAEPSTAHMTAREYMPQSRNDRGREGLSATSQTDAKPDEGPWSDTSSPAIGGDGPPKPEGAASRSIMINGVPISKSEAMRDMQMHPVFRMRSQSPGLRKVPEDGGDTEADEDSRLRMSLSPTRGTARQDSRSKATGFTAFFDRELSESTWQPEITDRENTLTLLYARQLEAKAEQKPAPVSALREEEETFSISASQVVPRPVSNRNSSASQLREGSVWRSDLGHKQMTPLEKLKTANLGFPTPFTAAIARRQESSEANMMVKWSRSRL